MATARSVNTMEARAVLCSPDSESPREDLLPRPDETSPLLQHKRAQGIKRNVPERWHSARLSASAFVDRNAGLLLVAASQFFSSSMNLSVKWLNSLDEPVPILELIWVGMAITYICSLAYMYMRKIPHPLIGPKGVRALLVLRGITGFFGFLGLYFSLQYLSLSDATVLTFLTPILTGFSGAIFLKEPLSLRELLAGLYSLFGVVLIARPQFLFGGLQTDPSKEVSPGQRIMSVIAALVGVLGATGAYTLVRAIGKRAHVFHSITFFSSQCVLGSTTGMILFKISPVIPRRPLWLAVLLLIGILSFIAQILLTMGLQRETASRGTLAIYTSVVFAVMFELIFFHAMPSALSIAGTVIIMSSAIYTSLTKKALIKSVTCAAVEQPAPTTTGCGDDPEP